MKGLMFFGVVVGLVLAPSAAMADWSDNFDSYGTGSINGLGGWQGWDGVAGAAGTVAATQSLSPPHSQAIAGAADSVHQYSGYTSGLWTYTAWQYIPALYTGQSYFILLNTYNDGGPYNWSLQIQFDAATNLVKSEFDDLSAPLIRGQWIQLRDEIDMTADTQSFYYNNQLVVTKSWTGGLTGSGALNIGAVDLYANSASAVYYDNMSLTPEPASLVLIGLGLLLVNRRR
jgi:hypothetical protein